MRHSFLLFLFCLTSILSAIGQNLDVYPFKVYGNNFSGYSDLPIDFDQKRIVLIGEKHRKKGNYPTLLKTFKYLHQHHQYSELIIEYGPSMSWLINKYLNGDDEAYRILDQYVFTEDEFFIWLKALRKYRFKTSHFEVHGIDLELQEPVAVKVLNLLHPHQNYPDALKDELNKMDRLLGKLVIDRNDYHKFNVNFVKFFYSYKKSFQSFLGDKFEMYEKIVRGIDRGLQYRTWRLEDINKAYHYREHFLFHNVKGILDQDPTSKALAQLGQIHVMKSNVSKFIKLEEWKSLSMRLIEKEYSLISMTYLYTKLTNKYDEEVLGENYYQEVLRQPSKKNAFVTIPASFQNPNFDWVILNVFDQPEKDPGNPSK